MAQPKPHQHVYCDANIFLDFFRFSDDDLTQLEKLIGQIDGSHISFYLPQHTEEEYYRNRDKVVSEQLTNLRNVKVQFGLPLFVRDHESSQGLIQKLKDASQDLNEILRDADEKATSRSFKADLLLAQIFEKSKKIETSPILILSAEKRSSLGNPPGKPSSIGDRLNWEALLQEVEAGNDLCIITRDQDYLADFKTATPNMFLIKEWQKQKQGSLKIFKGIKSFAIFVDQTIAFLNDPQRTEAIGYLRDSGSFSSTHIAISNLSGFLGQFTEEEVETLLQIALDNGQVGGIMGDDDVHGFYSSIRGELPWFGNIAADHFDGTFPDVSEVPF